MKNLNILPVFVASLGMTMMGCGDTKNTQDTPIASDRYEGISTGQDDLEVPNRSDENVDAGEDRTEVGGPVLELPGPEIEGVWMFETQGIGGTPESDQIIIEEAYINISKAYFEVKEPEGFSDEFVYNGFEFSGPYVSDLIERDQSHVSLFSDRGGNTKYSDVHVQISKLEEDVLLELPTIHEDIRGSSIVIRGIRKADGVRFVIKVDRTLDFELNSVDEGGFPFFASDKAILAFDRSRWVEGIDLSAVVSKSDLIEISREFNSEILDHFVLNLVRSSKLYKDQNQNGVLEGKELEEGLVAVPLL